MYYRLEWESLKAQIFNKSFGFEVFQSNICVIGSTNAHHWARPMSKIQLILIL